MTRVLTVLVAALAAATALATSPDPKDLAIPPQDLSRAKDLIRRLGSEVYREREEAQVELAKMGRLARPALQEAVSADPDPEVRFRCSRLLPKAGADDLKARLDTFLADTESRYEHDLPGLKQFSKVVGSDKAARDLFLEVIKSPQNLDLLQMVDRSGADGGRAICDRRMLLWTQANRQNFNGRFVAASPQEPTLADVATLLLAETLVPSKEIPRNNFWGITGVMFVQRTASSNAITNPNTPHAEAYKRIVAKWMETREDPTDLSNQLAYAAGQTLRSFKESVPLLRRIVKTEGVMGYAKGQALDYLIQLRGKEESAFVRGQLSNDTLVTTIWFGGNGLNPNAQHQCLVRDVALAVLLTQNTLPLADYGYKFPNGMVPPGNVHIGSYAFTSDEARGAAMVKFGFWRMRQGSKEGTSTPEPAPAPKTAPVPEKK
jgi:hypothetical protein